MQSFYPERFERDMACTEDEWLRWLPGAVGDNHWKLQPQSAGVRIGDGAIVAAEDFANTHDQAYRLLCDFPFFGEHAVHGTRILALHNFPYSLIYRIQGDEIRVIAIAHHSRRPGYWVGRR